MSAPGIVVTGATGKVGRLLADRLAGSPRLRLLVRDARRAPMVPGAEVVVADFRDADAVATALRPGDRVFMVSVHESVDDRIAAHRSFIEGARAADAGLVAYLSIVDPKPGSVFPHTRSHAETERLLVASGVPYTFVRMNLFLDDYPLWFDEDGVIRGPGDAGRVALCSRADIAAAAAVILTTREHEGTAVNMSGERSSSLGELAAIAAAATGRPLSYEPGTRESYLASRIAGGRTIWDAEAGLGSYDAVRLGEFDTPSTDVRRLTGTAAETPAAWAAANRDRFAVLGLAARRARGARTA